MRNISYTTKMRNKWISVLVCVVLLMTCIPYTAYGAVNEAEEDTRIVDTSTMDGWKEKFGSDVLSTQNAGSVWVDKSVFTNADAFQGTGIEMMGNNRNFLVALSTIAANASIEGMASIPTDTMIILDLSSSMYSGSSFDPTAVRQMVDAVNAVMRNLQELNPANRVGITIYFGGPNLLNSTSTSSCGKVLLPLGRYAHASDEFLLAKDSSGILTSISVNSSVTNAEGVTIEYSHTPPSVAGTYAQLGILHAMEEFLAADTIVPASGSYQQEVTRVPVFVFMSDGEPTAASNDFTNINATSVMGNNRVDIRNANETDFVTQLTAAYAKEMVDAHYVDTVPLFYTLSLGKSISEEVMDPEHNTTTTIDNYWNTLIAIGKVDITVQNCTSAWSINNRAEQTYTVSKASGFPSNISQRNYVNESFTAETAEELATQFEKIYSQIELKTRYFPTLVEGQSNLDGYVSFVDKIGEYMEVVDIKGILLHGTLFSGLDIARNFVTGGGNLGTRDNPTPLGDELVWSVQQRLGIQDVDTARTLLSLAYQYGQLSYTNDDTYSNYIGWYANAAGKFLGFYQEGVTVLPESTGATDTDPVYIIKSHGYLGRVHEGQGVTESDMMYVTVQVRKHIVTGEQTVAFAVPAALIPLVTYNVSLDGDGNLSDLTVSGADEPIRLVYEVALKDTINEYTLKEIVTEDYLAKNTNPDGSVNFYSNQYEANNATGYGMVNTYSYFNPSRQNDRYYYTENTWVYTDDEGTLYRGDTQPEGELYRAYTVYRKEGNALITETRYRRISDAALETTKKSEDSNTWYVPKGNVHVNLDGYTDYKDANPTETLQYVSVPFVDTHNHTVGEPGYSFYIGATLGNNGKLTVTPETGIRITKELDDSAITHTEPFIFTLTNISDTTSNDTYPTYRVTADNTVIESIVTFTNGKATVTLNPQETLYIGGMESGEIITVEETDTLDYMVKSVNGDSTLKSATITIVEDEFAKVHFVNENRGKGSLTIAKKIKHNLGADYQISEEKAFEMTVTLSGVGTANATFGTVQTNSDITQITTDANGCFTIQLKHDAQIEILDLPEGTVATVVENIPGTGFTASYWENGAKEEIDPFAEVTITDMAKATVLVVNDYIPDPVKEVNLKVNGTKYFKNYDGTEVKNWGDDTFTIVIERNDGSGWKEVDRITLDNEHRNFVFDLADEVYTLPGTYSYQVYEVEPASDMKPEGIFYDNVWHTFTVMVTDLDMDGELEISRVYSEHAEKDFEQVNGTWEVNIEFTNIQYVTAPVVATIDVQKLLENPSNSPLISLSGYSFGLYTDATCDTLARSYNAEDNTGIFGIKDIEVAPTDAIGEGWIDIIFDQSGEYTFYVKENVGSITNMNYSEAIVKVDITVVVGEGGRLVAEVSYDESTNDAGELEFTNQYVPKEAELKIDFVKKELSGRTLIANEFTFEIRNLDGTTVLTGTNNANGKVTFNGTLKYNQVGDYAYQVVELGEDANGVVIDKNIYEVHVTVTDTGGTLSASYTVVNVVANEIIFKNFYHAKEVSYAIDGNKILKGRVLLNDEFVFVMKEAMDANGTIVSDAKTYETKNFADGSFKFDRITYTEAGIYYYVVSEEEVEGATYGVAYDQTEFLVIVVVEDDYRGNLVVSRVDYMIKGNGTTNNITFVNQYVANPTEANIPGEKNLTGKVLTKDAFTFELYQSDSHWNMGDLIETVTNSEDGTFAFSTQTYDAAGFYYYIVKEENGGSTIDSVIYDDTRYHVWVEVTDGLRGQLYSKVRIFNGDGEPKEGIVFNNTCMVGDLIVNKLVEYYVNGNEVDSSLDNREDVEYRFTVTFEEGHTETFTLKAGESKIFENLIYGTPYTITEDTTGAVFTSTITNASGRIGEESTTVNVINRYDYVANNSGFTFTKVDEETTQPLAGAEFGLYEDEECTQEIATAISDKTGRVYFEMPTVGTYYLKETKAPEGYKVSPEVCAVTAYKEYVEMIPEAGEEASPYIEERIVIRAEELEVSAEENTNMTYIFKNTPIPEEEDDSIKYTGDNMMPTLYGITLLLAGMGVIFTAVKLRNKEEEEA